MLEQLDSCFAFAFEFNIFDNWWWFKSSAASVPLVTIPDLIGPNWDVFAEMQLAGGDQWSPHPADSERRPPSVHQRSRPSTDGGRDHLSRLSTVVDSSCILGDVIILDWFKFWTFAEQRSECNWYILKIRDNVVANISRDRPQKRGKGKGRLGEKGQGRG